MNLIRVKAFPDAKRPAIEETGPQTVRVFIRESPQNNAANRAIIRSVAAFYKIPENKLRLISGHRGLNKIIEIRPLQ